MTTRPPLIPVEQVDLLREAFMEFAFHCEIGTEPTMAVDIDDAINVALNALEASRLQARREALEEAAKVADGVWDEAARHIESYATNASTWRQQAALADRIRIAIRTLRGES